MFTFFYFYEMIYRDLVTALLFIPFGLLAARGAVGYFKERNWWWTYRIGVLAIVLLGFGIYALWNFIINWFI